MVNGEGAPMQQSITIPIEFYRGVKIHCQVPGPDGTPCQETSEQRQDPGQEG